MNSVWSIKKRKDFNSDSTLYKVNLQVGNKIVLNSFNFNNKIINYFNSNNNKKEPCFGKKVLCQENDMFFKAQIFFKRNIRNKYQRWHISLIIARHYIITDLITLRIKRGTCVNEYRHSSFIFIVASFETQQKCMWINEDWVSDKFLYFFINLLVHIHKYKIKMSASVIKNTYSIKYIYGYVANLKN